MKNNLLKRITDSPILWVILSLLIALFMWSCSMLFSVEYMAHYKNKLRYYAFSVITGLATVGVFLSADLYVRNLLSLTRSMTPSSLRYPGFSDHITAFERT